MMGRKMTSSRLFPAIMIQNANDANNRPTFQPRLKKETPFPVNLLRTSSFTAFDEAMSEIRASKVGQNNPWAIPSPPRQRRMIGNSHDVSGTGASITSEKNEAKMARFVIKETIMLDFRPIFADILPNSNVVMM